MQIFIDSTDPNEIREAAALGILDGVIAASSRLGESGRRLEDFLGSILDAVDGPIGADLGARDTASMIREGRKLANLHANVFVRLPFGSEGLKAARALGDENIRVNVTEVFQASQGLLAAKAGAAWVSPCVGRLDDISEDGIALVENLVEILDNYDYGTEILVTALRGPAHFVQSARSGADAAVCTFGLLQQLLGHPLSGGNPASAPGANRKTSG